MKHSPRQALLHRAKRDIPLLALVMGITLLVISKLRAFEGIVQPGKSELQEMQQIDLLAFLLSLIPAIFTFFLWRRWHDLRAELAYRSNIEELLSGLVLHDPCTNLSSRRLLVEHIEQALKNARRYHVGLSVFVIEIAGFGEIKRVNGDENAERLLSAVGDQLTAELRDADVVARLDDEHLAVLLPMVDGIDGAVIAAGRAQAALDRPFDLGRTKVSVRVHVGLAYFPGGGDDASTLLSMLSRLPVLPILPMRIRFVTPLRNDRNLNGHRRHCRPTKTLFSRSRERVAEDHIVESRRRTPLGKPQGWDIRARQVAQSSSTLL